MGIARQIKARLQALAHVLARFVLHGPSLPHDESPWLGETVFPWPIRLVIVMGTWLFARTWIATNTAGQIGWTLEYAGAITISLVASFWIYIFFIDLAASLAWLGLTWMTPPHPKRHPYWYWAGQIVEMINRQLTHAQAFLIWMGVLLPWSPRIDFQLPMLLGLALLAPSLINWITVRIFREAAHGRGELQSERRPVIYVAMIFGLALLFVRARDQWLNLLPLAIAFVVVTAIRIGRHLMRRQRAGTHRELVTTFRRHQREMTRGIDVMFGPVLMLLSVVGVLALSLWARQSHDRLAREALDGPPPDPRTCIAEPGGPVQREQSMFLIADSQVHELGGARFPGQTELADLLVPAAVRPVELDMLGSASVFALQHAFHQVLHETPRSTMSWAHLGDFADLSCEGELRRAIAMLRGFGDDGRGEPAKLAGLAPGNHDMSFTGNFLWSPYWTGACKSNLASKQTSNELLREMLETAGADVSPPNRSWFRRWLTGDGGLATVTPLGAVANHKLVAVFVDTSDDAESDWGIAGLFGTYSADQDRRLREKILAHNDDHTIWIAFAHHPIGELTSRSHDRVMALLGWLDHGAPADDPTPDFEHAPHLLGVIAAHTHHAETHRMCVARRVVREIVIGSTIDSAQQGALLEVGADARGVAALRLKTVQTVARPGFTCGERPPAILADDCQRIVARLKRDPACEPMFDEGLKTARDCSELEPATGLGEAVHDLLTSTSPVKPNEIRRAQQLRARRLLSCVCRPGTDPTHASLCPPLTYEDPLDDNVFAPRIAHRLQSGGDDARKELACLAWAASAQQQHKARGMTFASALRCAFDDQTIPAEQSTVASLDVQPCQ